MLALQNDIPAVSTPSILKHPFTREFGLFLVFAAIGIALVPLAVFAVGDLVFGAYGGDGFGHFFESLLLKLARLDGFAWLLVLSPYVVLQIFRGMKMAWRSIDSTDVH